MLVKLQLYLIASAVWALVTMTGCAGHGKGSVPVDTVAGANAEEYHADNDIAMTLRSVVDALRVGEKLDSVDYDFKGVLTDGQGRPLYTDLSGTPGVWEVDVTSPSSVVIRNANIGDLLPWDLEHYLVQCLELSDEDRLPLKPLPEGSDEIHRAIYDFGSGYLRFETRRVTEPGGAEGAIMNITATGSAPIANPGT